MDLGLTDRVAIVTGGSKGIGRYTALSLAQEGVDVTICSRGVEALEETAQEIRFKTGRRVLAIKADMGKPDDIKSMVDSTVSELGGVNILINNAVTSMQARFMDLTDEDWKTHIDLKIMGYVRCSREVIPHMQRRGGGRIINIGGIAARRVYERLFTNGVTNSAVANLAKNLSDQFAADNILVNCIHPGSTFTPRLEEGVARYARNADISYDEAIRRAVAEIPIGRLVRPEEVADLAVYLVSNRAGAIAGQSIAVDGNEPRGIYY